MGYILSLDQGTTSSRSLIIDHKGRILAIAQKEFQQFFPESGLVEHDPEEIWSTQISVAHEALAKTNLSGKDIAAIGITNQRETCVVWNRHTGKPIFRAIVWQDRRTTFLCEQLKKKNLEGIFRNKTGLLLDPYFSGTKLHWILESVPNARKLAEQGDLAFGTIDTWLIWKLTEGKLHVTDATNASRTLLYNIHTGKWDEELLEILNIPPSMLPEVKSSSEIYGHTAPHLFSSPIPIAGVAGDQQAALFGQNCFTPGTAKATFGTGCFILMNTGTTPILSKNNLLTTVAYQLGGETYYALEGSVFIAGAVVQWLKDNLKLIRKSSDVDLLAASVPDSGGVYFIPAFTGLGAPHWDPRARGAILGLSRGTTDAHIARAALESIAYQAAEVFQAMEIDSGIELQEIRVDGGAIRSDLLMQFLSDLLQTAVLRPKDQELTGLGAAMLAGLAVGFWKNQEELKKIWSLDRKFTSQIDSAKSVELLKQWTRALQRVLQWESPP